MSHHRFYQRRISGSARDCGAVTPNRARITFDRLFAAHLLVGFAPSLPIQVFGDLPKVVVGGVFDDFVRASIILRRSLHVCFGICPRSIQSGRSAQLGDHELYTCLAARKLALYLFASFAVR